MMWQLFTDAPTLKPLSRRAVTSETRRKLNTLPPSARTTSEKISVSQQLPITPARALSSKTLSSDAKDYIQ